MKQLLILGGKPIGSTDLVSYANEKGIHTIVTDYLSEKQSPAKKEACEQWDISTADVELLLKKAEEAKVDGIIAGVHEFCIRKGIELCEKLGLPLGYTLEQWDNCNNKKKFKKLCKEHGISVAQTYQLEDKDISFPVIVKPADSDGSRGFSICNDREELKKGVMRALEYSKDYLIEEFMQCDACIIHYTAINGKIIFSGISDKYSKKLEEGSMVMALQVFPSKDEQRYLDTINEKAIKLFEDIGIQNAPIWIEAFNDGERFVFNEMALRLGGSMTNYPVQYYTGIDQMELMINAALGNPYLYIESKQKEENHYVIFPIHVRAGKIARISGLEKVEQFDFVHKVVLVHQLGEEIESWGTAQQVFCYVHLTFKEKADFLESISNIKSSLHVTDSYGEEQLFYLMDFEQ